MILRTSIGILLLFLVCGIGNSQIVEIPYKNWPNYGCLNSHNPEKFVINSKEGLDKIGHCNLSNFDIDKHTIIGIYGFSLGDIKPIVSYRIIKNTDLKIYNIDASVYCGHFTYLRINHTYYRKVVFTDKLDPEYEIDFNVQIIYDK
jgi:hypothetical protein